MTFTTRLVLSSFLLLLLLLSITITTGISVYNTANAAKHHSHSIAPDITNKSPITTTTTNLPPATRGNVNSQPPSPIVHNTRARVVAGGPTLNNPELKLERLVDTGLKSTTSMAFLGPDDILVLEKDTGMVHRILNDKLLSEPVLDVNVANEAERGLLGIAIAKPNSATENGDDDNKGARYVFLYYTESAGGRDGDDASSGVEPAGNRLYKYDLEEDGNGNNVRLTHPLLLLDLPASPPAGRENIERQHMGGKVLIGPDNNVYVGIGDDGYLYIITLNGSIYRIVPNSSSSTATSS